MKPSPDVEKAIKEAKQRVDEKRSQFMANSNIAASKRKALKR